jgi:hypothetical protein
MFMSCLKKCTRAAVLSSSVSHFTLNPTLYNFGSFFFLSVPPYNFGYFFSSHCICHGQCAPPTTTSVIHNCTLYPATAFDMHSVPGHCTCHAHRASTASAMHTVPSHCICHSHRSQHCICHAHRAQSLHLPCTPCLALHLLCTVCPLPATASGI